MTMKNVLLTVLGVFLNRFTKSFMTKKLFNPSGEPIEVQELAERSIITRRDISVAIAKGTQSFKDWLGGQQTNQNP